MENWRGLHEVYAGGDMDPFSREQSRCQDARLGVPRRGGMEPSQWASKSASCALLLVTQELLMNNKGALTRSITNLAFDRLGSQHNR